MYSYVTGIVMISQAKVELSLTTFETLGYEIYKNPSYYLS